MGAVEGVLAIQFGPIMTVLARWAASTVSMGAVLHPCPVPIDFARPDPLTCDEESLMAGHRSHDARFAWFCR